MSVEFDIQAAIFTALDGDATLSGLVTGVYDRKQQDADGGSNSAFPYVTIGQIILGMDDTDTSLNFDAAIRIHTWSRTGSKKQCLDIQGAIYDVLHKGTLTVSGWDNYSTLRDVSRVFVEEDGATHGVCEYRALLQKV